jgi:small subunit ribosomal protein S2
MPRIPTLTELLEAGAHFGHQASRWHPKMADFIFGARGGVHVVNLEKTQEKLEEALNFVRDVASRGGMILFVGTKSQAKSYVKTAAESCGMPYVSERWLGGTLTNFKQIRDTVERFLKLKEQQEKGELEKYTKLERLMISREIDEYRIKVGGIVDLKKRPAAVFITDVRFDKTAMAEASACEIPIVGVCDTNVNPADVNYVIPMNDDAVRAIELVTKLVAEAVNEGKSNPVKVEPVKSAPQPASPTSSTSI